MFSERCTEHCESCTVNGKDKCDICLNGYVLTNEKTCAHERKQGEASSRTVYVWGVIYIYI